jgi:hypothetical protein
VIDSLQKENHVAREKLDSKRLRLNDDHRRRWAIA